MAEFVTANVRAYWRDVNREGAEAALTDRPPYSFVIRPSSLATLAVSFVAEDGKVVHALVEKKGSMFAMDGDSTEHESLEGLLKAHYLLPGPSDLPATSGNEGTAGEQAGAAGNGAGPGTGHGGGNGPNQGEKLLLRVSHSVDNNSLPVTKGLMLSSETTVEEAVGVAKAKFKIADASTSYSLYAPAPINSWLKRSAALGSYKFLKACDVELRPFAEATATAKRSTQILDLNAGKPMILKVIQSQANDEIVARKMMFSTSDKIDRVIESVRGRFGIESEEKLGLYSPPPFNLWLEPFECLGHYQFLHQHNDVVVKPKETDVLLKVTWESGDIVRSLKVPAHFTVRDVISRLVLKNPVDSPDEWGIVGKEPDRTAQFWLPDDASVSSFTRVNMSNLVFKRRDEATRALRRHSRMVASGLAERPKELLGVPPELLEQMDDAGTLVPACLVRVKDALVDAGGLLCPGIFVSDGDSTMEQGAAVFADIRSDNELDRHPPHLLAAAIKLFFARLPVRIFQPLEKKLEKAATNYEASLLLAAQLPQQHGLLLAWLMTLLVDLCMNSSSNGVSVVSLGNVVGPLLVSSSDAVVNKLRRIVAVILQDKVDELIERSEMLVGIEETALETAGLGEALIARPEPAADSAASQRAVEVSKWGVNEVCEWSGAINIDGIQESLRVNGIDGPRLLAFGENDLAILGLTKLGPKKKFLKSLADLKSIAV